jgi:hypothetical protein
VQQVDSALSDETQFIDGELFENMEEEEDAAALHYTSSNRHKAITWLFHIIYSEVWKVPILYFTVRDEGSGLTLSMNEIIHMRIRSGPDGCKDLMSNLPQISQEVLR